MSTHLLDVIRPIQEQVQCQDAFTDDRVTALIVGHLSAEELAHWGVLVLDYVHGGVWLEDQLHRARCCNYHLFILVLFRDLEQPFEPGLVGHELDDGTFTAHGLHHAPNGRLERLVDEVVCVAKLTIVELRWQRLLCEQTAHICNSSAFDELINVLIVDEQALEQTTLQAVLQVIARHLQMLGARRVYSSLLVSQVDRDSFDACCAVAG